MKTRSRETEDSQEKWNKKKQLNSRSRKNQLLYKRAPPCKHVPTSGFIWPVHPDSYHVAPWLFLQTCPPLNVQKRGKSPLPHPTNKQKKEDWSPWFIHSQRQFFSDLWQSLSHAWTHPVFHFVPNVCGFLRTFQHQEAITPEKDRNKLVRQP